MNMNNRRRRRRHSFNNLVDDSTHQLFHDRSWSFLEYNYYCSGWENWNTILIDELLSTFKNYLFKKNGIRFHDKHGVIINTSLTTSNKFMRKIRHFSASSGNNRSTDFIQFANYERLMWQEFNNEQYLRGHPTYNQYRQNLKQLLITFFCNRSLADIVAIVCKYLF